MLGPAGPAGAQSANWLFGRWSTSPTLCPTATITFAPGQIVETVEYRGQVRRAITRGVTYKVIGPKRIELTLPSRETAGPGPRFEEATRADPDKRPGEALLRQGNYGLRVVRCR